ncbi:hypothetical protein WJX72_008255 [[Myrmecia] bisecta]|uniref:Uncharacterized protein n=1 Tax=[Myrmecia] bisecta TaxID=41462 RepID=A0AAW1R8Y0_9CHLO
MTRVLSMRPAGNVWAQRRARERFDEQVKKRAKIAEGRGAAAASRGTYSQDSDPSDTNTDWTDTDDEDLMPDATTLNEVEMGVQGGVWEYYVRLMCIAGYRMVQAMADDAIACSKDLILETLTACCPPDPKTVHNTFFQHYCNNPLHDDAFVRLHAEIPLGRQGPIHNKFRASGQVWIKQLMDANNRTMMDAGA